MSEDLTLVVLGGGGRMGRAVLAAAADDPSVRIAGALVRADPGDLPGTPRVHTGIAEALNASPGAVAVDFTTPVAAVRHLEEAAATGHPVVMGTTGLGEAGERAVAAASARIPVVEAPNTSAGIALLGAALRVLEPGRSLGWSASVLDRHHRGKRDAPSGTARLMEGILSEAGWQVQVASFREGGVIGEHTVHLTGDDEELVLVHRAFSRGVFARGALLAARFAAGASPGRYGMADVLGIGARNQ